MDAITAEAEQVTVEGGVTWQALLSQLAQKGRRPLVLPETLNTSIADTLLIDGTGDATHLHGAIAKTVSALTLVTPDGTRRELHQDSELARFIPGAGSALGVISQVTLRTLRQPSSLVVRSCAWTSVPEFVRDILICAALQKNEFVRARLFFGAKKCVVRGILGSFDEDVDTSLLRPVSATESQRIDLLTEKEAALPPGPWLGLGFSLPDGLRIWPELCLFLEETGVMRFLARGGTSIAVVPELGLPLGPAAGWSLRVIIRPHAPPTEWTNLTRLLRDVATRALEWNGTPLLTGTTTDAEFRELRQQRLSTALMRLESLKQSAAT